MSGTACDQEVKPRPRLAVKASGRPNCIGAPTSAEVGPLVRAGRLTDRHRPTHLLPGCRGPPPTSRFRLPASEVTAWIGTNRDLIDREQFLEPDTPSHAVTATTDDRPGGPGPAEMRPSPVENSVPHIPQRTGPAARTLAVGDPAAAPPVSELDQPATFDPGAEDDDGIGELGVVAADVVPGGLAGGGQGAGRRSTGCERRSGVLVGEDGPEALRSGPTAPGATRSRGRQGCWTCSRSGCSTTGPASCG